MNCNRYLVPLARQCKMALEPRRNYFTRRIPSSWGLVDLSTQMENMERTFARMEREMNSAFGIGSPYKIPKFFEPTSSRLFCPVIEGETAAEGENGGGKYIVKMELGKSFDPENVKVTLKDRVVTVEAKFEHKSEDGKSRMYQEFCKSFTLPTNVKVEEIKSLFTPEGQLVIEAPIPVVEAPKPTEIPILKE